MLSCVYDVWFIVIPVGVAEASELLLWQAIKEQEIVLYALHLDWRYCSYYLPRGFHSSQWIPIDRKVTDPEELLEEQQKENMDEDMNMGM